MSPGVDLYGLNALACKSCTNKLYCIACTLPCNVLITAALERKLSNRAPKQELLDKNILHG